MQCCQIIGFSEDKLRGIHKQVVALNDIEKGGVSRTTTSLALF